MSTHKGCSSRKVQSLADTAAEVLDNRPKLLSADEYETLCSLPFDAAELSRQQMQQKVHEEQRVARKQTRSTMLGDVKRSVRRRHGRNSKYIIAAMEQPNRGAWQPKKKISRADMERLRLLHKEMPHKYNFDRLAFVFGISRNAVTKILRSKWQPTPEGERRQAQQKNRADRMDTMLGAQVQHMLPSEAFLRSGSNIDTAAPTDHATSRQFQDIAAVRDENGKLVHLSPRVVAGQMELVQQSSSSVVASAPTATATKGRLATGKKDRLRDRSQNVTIRNRGANRAFSEAVWPNTQRSPAAVEQRDEAENNRKGFQFRARRYNGGLNRRKSR